MANEIELFTDGALNTITSNHKLEINSIKKKCENQIKNMKKSNEEFIKKLKYDSQLKIDSLKFENSIINNENNSLKLEISKLQEEIIKKDFIMKDLNEKKNYLKKYDEILKNQELIIKSLKIELNKAIIKSKDSWEIFQKMAPDKYEYYLRHRKVKNNKVFFNPQITY